MLIRLETNTHIAEERIRPLSRSLAVALSRLTGTLETEWSVELAGNRRMRMAASDEPIAHVEVRGVEYPKEEAKALASAVSTAVEEHLAIIEDNVYIAVVSNRLSMWRVGGGATRQ